MTYDGIQDKFVVFVFGNDGTNGGIIYQYSGAADSTYYSHIPIVVQNT